MSLDVEVEQAVYDAVDKLGQGDRLAKRFLSWLKDLSEQELSAQEDNEHLESVRRAVHVHVDEG